MTNRQRAGQDAVALASTGQSHSVRRDLLLLLLAAAIYRLFFLWAVPPVVDSADALRYLTAAEQRMTGELDAVSARIPPLYPVLASGLHWLGLGLESAARTIALLASIFLVIPVYLLAVRMHHRRAALIAGFLVAFWPWLADWGCRIAPESLAVLFWFCGIWFLAIGAEGKRWALAAAGLTFFLLHLTRPEGLFLCLAAPVAFLLIAWTMPRVWPNTGIVAATVALLLGGQAILARSASGAASVTARVDVEGTWQYVFVDRGAELLQTLNDVVSHNLPVMLGPVLLLFAGAGAFRAGSRPQLRLEFVVVFFIALQCALAVLSTWPEPRYIMAPVVAVALWSARGVSDTMQSLKASRFARWSLAPVILVFALMAAGTASTVLPEYVGRTPRAPREYRIAGEWLKARGEPGLIVCRKPQVGYYADMPSTGPVDYPTMERFIVWLHAIDAKYLVVDERYTAKMTNVVAPLLDPSKAPPELEILADELSPYPDARIVIYEVLEEAAEP